MSRNSIDHAALPARPRPKRTTKRASVPAAALYQPASILITFEAVARIASRLGSCTTEHVLQQLDLPITRPNEMEVAKHLKTLGYSKARIMVQGVRVHAYFPPLAA